MSMESLTILVPELFAPPPVTHGAETLRADGLERLLAWSQRQPALAAYHAQLMQLFSLPEQTAAGPYAWSGEGEEAGAAVWMRADPVHLQADMANLLLFEGRQLGVSAEEAAALVAAFNDHFQQREGMVLFAPHPSRWYLQLQRLPAISTHSVEQVSGRSPSAYLPQGDDARYWQGVLMEAQMLFHQHPVNRQRQQNGQLTINGLWVDGAGRLEASPQTAFRRVVAEDPLARGLGRLAGTALVQGQPAIAAGDLWVIDGCRHAALAADGHGWREAIAALEVCIDQVLLWMSDKRNRLVTLYPCNSHLYRMDGRKLRLFWRRLRPFYRYYND